MTLSEMWPDHRLAMPSVQGGYLLHVEYPKTGAARIESSTTLLAAVARASELTKAGYRTEIWCPVSDATSEVIRRQWSDL